VSASETVEVTGHLMDSGILSRILDDIREYEGDYVIDRFDVGHEAHDSSRAVITVSAADDEALQRLLMRLQTRGVNQVDPGEATLDRAELDGVFPEGFYSTTNLPTKVRFGSNWVDVENPEMDCGLVVEYAESGAVDRVITLPMSDVRVGMYVVCGASGVRVQSPVMDKQEGGFGFMESEVSSEKPQGVLVRQVADGMREAKAAGKKVLWVGGPGVVHTGAAPAMVAMVHAGFVDVLFAGNALATHDIESALYGTSLGVDLAMGRGVEHGHEHHIRALNTIRRVGSIRAAVDSGLLTGGIMHAMVTHEKTFVLVGSVRDDGPLPDVYTDVIEGQRAMRAEIKDVGFCLMVATMLHSVATGNILPAAIPLVCVDINPATVTKLADRGSSHARGIVTDVGLLPEPAVSDGRGRRRRSARPGCRAAPCGSPASGGARGRSAGPRTRSGSA
jgi:lysine-ketoglutarate reductase/saccharopine dehydrogenase-like protein (TIGR00300 family)